MGVRVGLIGAGIMGADHARILATQVAGASLAVVCDADADRARAVADATGTKHVSNDPYAVIADPGVDAVLIASPDDTHSALALACIAAGKPVLCEKPLSPSSDECLQIVEAESRLGRRLVQVGFMRRYDPSYVAMKETLADGAIGAPLIFHCIHRNVSAPSWFTETMAITNSAPHEFDIARFVLDAEFRSISVFRPTRSDGAGTAAPVFMVAEMASGVLVDIEVNNFAAYGYDVRGELVGATGTVSLRTPVHTELNVGQARSTRYAADWRPRFADAYRLQNQSWIRSVAAAKPEGASAWDGYCAACVAEAGARALLQGRSVTVDLADRPALY